MSVVPGCIPITAPLDVRQEALSWCPCAFSLQSPPSNVVTILIANTRKESDVGRRCRGDIAAAAAVAAVAIATAVAAAAAAASQGGQAFFAARAGRERDLRDGGMAGAWPRERGRRTERRSAPSRPARASGTSKRAGRILSPPLLKCIPRLQLRGRPTFWISRAGTTQSSSSKQRCDDQKGQLCLLQGQHH